MPQFVAINKLGIGTAQWGGHYGISNKNGKTNFDEVRLILSIAKSAGISLLDTACLYGDSETVLGANSLDGFKVVTKTPKFLTKLIVDEHIQLMFETFNRSLQKLGIDKVDGLLVHHSQDIYVEGGEKLVAGMMRLKDGGKVSKIGVSLYDGDELDLLFNRFIPDLVQVPLNVLDQRLIRAGTLQRLKDNGVEIHVRSVFLQGLLLMPLEEIPLYFHPIRSILEEWHIAAQEQKMSLVQAALSYIRDLPEIDKVLVGIETADQLQSCLKDFSNTKSFDATGLACNNLAFINPALWRKS